MSPNSAESKISPPTDEALAADDWPLALQVLAIICVFAFTSLAFGQTAGTSGLKVQYRTHDTEAIDNQIYAQYMVVNNGATAVPLSALTLRYWYTIDGVRPQTFDCDYALLNCSNITGKFVTMPSPANGADSYVEVGFSAAAGMLQPGQPTGEIQTRIHKNDWSNYNQADDYSIDSAQKFVYEDWPRVTLYLNGALVWGVEPSGATPPTSQPDTTPPSVPTALNVTGHTATSISLSWTASTDNIGVASYDILNGSTAVGNSRTTAFTVTSLAPNTSYTFAVRAKDAAGNTSATSATVSAMTDAASTATSGLKVQYRSHDTDPIDNQIYAHYIVVNNTTTPVPLSALTLRYWYTIDGARPQTFNCDYALVNCSNITGKFTTLPSPRTGADSYVEVGFTAGAGTLQPGQQSGEIQTRIHKNDWSNYLQSNDYSIDPAQQFVYEDWPRVTLYLNGVRVWGVEP
jgi:hypothetical protein